MSRKNLNDAIHGDRSIVRGTHTAMSSEDTWDAWEKKHRMKAGNDQYGATGGSSVTEFKAGPRKTYASDFIGDHKVGARCYHSHPALKLPNSELVIYGGSCSMPAVSDADVYIGFDHGMRFTQRHWPWKQGSEVMFEIADMSIPKKPEEFRKLVAWTKKQLETGLKVHCGCIGGHGRTGMFFAAVVSEFGEKDAIAYVREHYCASAVESASQVTFLHDEYGVTRVGGSKTGGGYSSHGGSSKGAKSKASSKSSKPGSAFSPLAGNGCIWDPPT